MTDLIPLLTTATAIVGTTGAGKSYLARGAIEQLLVLARRVVIIDPTGVWWGLRSAPQGEQDGGFPVVIFGGDHADIPITEHDGKAIAEAMAQRQVQAIIDVSDMTGGERTRFLTDYLETLYAKNRSALHLVFDEADEQAPQNPMPETRRLGGVVDKIVRRGRVKGFRPLMITQRPAVLHKNVLSQIGTLIALKLTSPQDRKAIEDWVSGNADAGQAKAVMKSLPQLKRGEGWVWSPAASVLERQHFPKISTYDSGRTPEDGEIPVEPVMSWVDIDELAGALAGNRPKPDGEAEPAHKGDIEQAWKEGHDAGFSEGIEHGKTLGISLGLTRARAALDRLTVPAITADGEKSSTIPQVETPAKAALTLAARKSSGQNGKKSSADPLLAAAISIWPARLSWPALAAMCGRKARGGHFNGVRKALLDDGHVRMDGDLVTLLHPPAQPAGTVPADLLEENLPQPSAKMFSAIRKHPAITVAELAAHLGMQPRGGHWNTGMSVLRNNGLIDQRGEQISIRPELEA